MEPIEYAFAIGKFIVEYFYEKDKESKSKESISKAIKEATITIINTIKKYERIKYQGKLDGLYERFDRITYEYDLGDIHKKDELQRQMTDLKDEISSITSSLERFCIEDLDFFTFDLYPAYINAMSLKISVYLECEKKLGMVSSDILTLEYCLEPLLEAHHRVSMRMYEDLFNRHPYIVIGRNHPVFDFFAKEGYAPIKAEINIKMLDMILFEQFIQQIRYLYIHNLNNDFKMSSHYRNSKYAGFNFNCPKYDIVQIDDSKNALAVHNAGGSSLKSIYKDVLDLPNEAEIKFKVNISSLKIGREVEINIYELEPHTKNLRKGANGV
ncbi:hypothetical protein SIL80_24665 [Bacillus cereus group sp. BfR-BA-01119]|uniref:hypothetical protein n=1 Tax=Bacillus cereus group sp. BfR-BA-01119 TaxID=3094878 RepID=UPI0029C2D404|nr:hypothetical protein [Bacillus cereus group sp. BfR-BA-01119]MDX5869017.1 hypothetical protein [Bacillus cereus group sp. BfR-BA-01119]